MSSNRQPVNPWGALTAPAKEAKEAAKAESLRREAKRNLKRLIQGK